MRANRFFLDKLAARLITIGGLSIIVFILLVFFYLFRQVTPLFDRAEVSLKSEQNLPSSIGILYAGMNEYNDALVKLESDGIMTFYDFTRDLIIGEERLPIYSAETTNNINALARDEPTNQLLAVADNQGGVLMVGYEFSYDFSSGRRLTHAKASYPLGTEAVQLSASPLQLISSLTDEKSTTIIGYDTNGQLHGKVLLSRKNSITGQISRHEQTISIPELSFVPDFIKVFDRQSHCLLASRDGKLMLLALENGTARIKQEILLENNIYDVNIMLGANSLLVADSTSSVHQWFMVRGRDDEGSMLQKIRSFSLPNPVTEILPVRNSKSFIALTEIGDAVFINAPSSKQSFSLPIANNAQDITAWAISPRADGIVAIANDGKHSIFTINNPHPDISISRLFGKIWYEGYEEPSYTWQSTSGGNDFEPKYSLVPLTFGTLKAAAYAMMFSTPLAIAGAIYTAFFMGSRLRKKIKPVIEMMEAFPTVILGFIAGIIMAPYFERNLPGILSILLLLPPLIILFGFGWRWARSRFKPLNNLSEALAFIPFVLLAGWILLQLSPFIELSLFNGDMRSWLNQQGFSYNQRNALVIGVAMGLAVIPTIYSIAEDAIYSVPRLMVNGAYALGATQLQNTITIVIPAALSGIISAIMIGFGRAVGETMIVLMATGNTPVMDLSIFTGMRTLAANIAVEMPEAAVGSTHFRVLFLCGLLLLLFTFAVNIIAEVVRHRIRRKYANI